MMEVGVKALCAGFFSFSFFYPLVLSPLNQRHCYCSSLHDFHSNVNCNTGMNNMGKTKHTSHAMLIVVMGMRRGGKKEKKN